ncbi:MAG TPA: nicotinate-nucleotide--dimethylbenzimidazole phosphoribosyltransferase [Nocardioidaceae bacterium]|nr:nicotinate-nucleotide--dimethylbenzimidazole phosphoribosyltransferase [Nocardioidaceae bacterium]
MTPTPEQSLRDVVDAVLPRDAAAMSEARARQAQLTKPAGSLGVLEEMSVALCGVQRTCPPRPLGSPVVAIFAGDHGVHAQGVSPWPQEVTASMVANFRAGGAAVNVLARQAGAEVVVVDMGVACDLEPGPDLLDHKIRPGTSDLAVEPAMTRQEALAGLLAGVSVADRLVDRGHDVLLTGDMGIANTTPSAALVSALTGADPAAVTGRGTGVDDAVLARKVDVVASALASRPVTGDPVDTLASVGGFEHAGIAGLLLGAARRGVPVVLDGVIAGAAALVARALAPEVVDYCLAGHRSVEPGHAVALAELGLRPLVDLDLRLGEGTGALLALPLVQAAGATLREMATFDSAGVARKEAPDVR